MLRIFIKKSIDNNFIAWYDIGVAKKQYEKGDKKNVKILYIS